MYKTPLWNYLWQFYVKRAKMNKSFFKSVQVYINQQSYKCGIVRMRNLVDLNALNDINKVTETNIICSFQHLPTNLDLSFTFALIEVNFQHLVTKIWTNLQTINFEMIRNHHIYWIVPISLFKVWKIHLNDLFFVN